MKNAKRLPSVGTVIEKKDRAGKVVAKCEVEAEGIRYKRVLYKSLSAAAAKAASDHGAKGTTKAGHGQVNGFVWWGLGKPAKATAKPRKAKKAPRKSKLAVSADKDATDDLDSDVRF